MEFRVLGPLEVRLGDERLPLGGARQRAVLAALLLRAGEVVPVERLVDEVWDDPPPSAAHTLESYVSRLRQLLHGRGPGLVRRGAGYVLELDGAALDAHLFVALHDEATHAAAGERWERVLELSENAIAVWRGPVLADVPLASAGRAEAERLEEVRLRAHELRFDAALALGRHEHLVGELQALVRQHPYRERFVAQLMLALYRSGRHADALDAYERTRAALSEDLGLQPSLELRQLSGQIVRQDPQLRRPATPLPARPRPAAVRGRTRRVSALVALGGIVAAAMVLTASGGAARLETATPVTGTKRVALLLPRAPARVPIDDVRVRETAAVFGEQARAWGYKSEILVADEVAPSPEELERTAQRLEDGGFALVLVSGGGATARALAPLVRRLTGTRFVFIDSSLAALSLESVPNATGMPFADHESSRLAGYLSGLVSPRRGLPGERADVVSVVASRDTPRIERVVRAFARGARQALPRLQVRVDYVDDERNKTVCERLANDQIDAGSDLVFAVAGECSVAALAVAGVRGVWGIRVNGDGVGEGRHILATTYKRWDQAVEAALEQFRLGTLRLGHDVELGLADEYAVDVWGSDSASPPISESTWSKVVRVCTSIRRHTESDAA